MDRRWQNVELKSWPKAYRRRNKILRQFLEFFFSLVEPSEKLAALREIANMNFLPTGKDRLKVKRAKFNKHKGWKMSLDTNCAVCQKRAQLRHHIIQLTKGGTNGHHNLLALCVSCHEEVHPWMKRLRQRALL